MDTSTRAAEAVQEAIERRIRAEYGKAQRELMDKLHGFIEAHKVREAKYRALVAAGKMSQEDFDAWMQGQIFQSKQWMRMRDSIAKSLYQADVAAQKIVNGERGNIFAQSANHTLYDLEHETGVTFGFELYDQATVAKILRDQPTLLPPKQVAEAKDINWYRHKINSVVIQGILQGEGIGQIATRVGRETGELSRNSMLRNARTAMTSAHSAGKLDAMHAMQERGIEVKKRWVATLDMKTRPMHAALDGVEVDIDEPFTTPLGDINRPGDPHAPASLVYNCRCMLFSVYGKYPISYTRRDMNGNLVKDMTYSEWARQMGLGNPPAVNGKQYGVAVTSVSDQYRDGLIAVLDNAPENVRKTWLKYTGQLDAPQFDTKPGDAAAFYSPNDEHTHFKNEEKAYKKNHYQDEYVCYFHEYGHNIDALAAKAAHSVSRSFSESYKGGSFAQTIHEEIKGHLRDFYLRTHPSEDMWWEKDGFDYILAVSKLPGSMSLEYTVADYLQTLKLSMPREQYRAIRGQIFDSGGRESVLRAIWEKFGSDPTIKATIDADRKSSAETFAHSTYLNKDNAMALAKAVKGSYTIYETTDISDMFEGYMARFGIEHPFGVGHGREYWETWTAEGKALRTTAVAEEAFAEMFSATMTGNASLGTIKKFFPRSYAIFEEMLGAM